MKEIIIKNSGRIPLIRIPVPENGGVVELLGTNGAGKTNLLNTIRRMGGADMDVSVRDGEDSASVEAPGIKMVFGKRTKAAGELELLSFESFADISDLVEPHIDDKLSADKKRIHVLLKMSGVKPDKEMFSALLNGSMEKFSDVILSTDIIEDDIVATAAKVKRRFEERARAFEQNIVKAKATIDANSKDIAGIDLLLAEKVDELRNAHESSIAHKASTISKKDSTDKILAAAAQAQKQLEAGAKFEETSEQITNRGAELRQKIQAAKATLQVMESEMNSIESLFKAVKAHEESTAHWKASIEAAKDIKAVTDEDIAATSKAADDAKTQYEAALTASRLSKKAAEIEEYKAQLDEATEQAQIFRDAAKNTDTVLAKALKLEDIRIKDGRLVTDTEERGETFFAELSAGEKYKMAIRWGAKFLGKGGMLVAQQEAWEGLVPSNRDEIREYAIEHSIVLFTARADESSGDKEVRARVYEPSTT